MSSDYLKHYGIQGMRWGVRRYENEDGTLTAAGKRRYGQNLDLNDKSRTNIAKIRLGEARRRFDVSKKNNDTNKFRQAELKGRIKSAKRAVRDSKSVDKGAALAAKGRTILGEHQRTWLGYGAAYVGSKALVWALNMRLNQLKMDGKFKPSTLAAAQFIANNGTYMMLGAAFVNDLAKGQNIKNLRAYNTSRWDGSSTIKRVGSQEYADVIARSKKK